ncbi:MAG: D-alanyl-D-alanine carboxypeptidase, partial [Akkermansiaceae bacterium]|nr:D-alanyl-D-alanine carboxypeptidase [Akkermansiaceae bacterium]
DPVTIEHSDTTVEPTKLYLKPGHQYERGDLLKAILVRSAN